MSLKRQEGIEKLFILCLRYKLQKPTELVWTLMWNVLYMMAHKVKTREQC